MLPRRARTLDQGLNGLSQRSTGWSQLGMLGLASGTSRVPGMGNGAVDTVPAMLAPGEAVLNRAASDALGRGLIAALNQRGAQKMGLV